MDSTLSCHDEELPELGSCDEWYASSSSSPFSLSAVSPLTSPELSDNEFETTVLPSPLNESQTPVFDSDPCQQLSVASNSFVLVIGGLGYIGSHTVLELLRAGHNGTNDLPGSSSQADTALSDYR